jgi:hypothetical protein
MKGGCVEALMLHIIPLSSFYHLKIDVALNENMSNATHHPLVHFLSSQN